MKPNFFRGLRRIAVCMLAVLLFILFSSCGEKVNEDGSLDFSSVDLARYITLGDYRAISYELEIQRVTDADVEQAIKEFEMSLGSYEDYAGAPPSRDTQENDYLQIRYVGRIDGEIVDESPEDTPQYLLVADGNGYYEWINRALIGVSVGETVRAEGRLDENEKYGEYAGKTITYDITPVAIMGHYTFVELTDEVLLEKTGCENIEAYRQVLYTALEDARKQQALSTIYQEAWDKAQACSTIRKYPRKQIEYYYNAFYGNYAYIAYQNNVSIDAVFELYGVDEDGIMEMAALSTAEDLFYYALVQAEGLEVTDEEYEARVGGIAAGQGVTVAELEEEFGKEYIRDSMLYDEAILFVAEVADVTYLYSE